MYTEKKYIEYAVTSYNIASKIKVRKLVFHIVVLQYVKMCVLCEEIDPDLMSRCRRGL